MAKLSGVYNDNTFYVVGYSTGVDTFEVIDKTFTTYEGAVTHLDRNRKNYTGPFFIQKVKFKPNFYVSEPPKDLVVVSA